MTTAESEKLIAEQQAAIFAVARRVGLAAQSCGVLLRTAESCSGGLLASALTESAGASAWFECAYICYSNAAKEKLLGVSPEILQRFGAVSEETAAAMCCGAGDFSLSITGIAGPDGGSIAKPVGMVCFGWQANGKTFTQTHHFGGTRKYIRQAAVLKSLQVMEEKLK